MADYQHHPDYSYGIEVRDGWTAEDYIAQARGFRSTAEFLEYRDASPERQKEIRRNRDRHNNNIDDGDILRYAAYLRISQ
jgi:hypothetical protein